MPQFIACAIGLLFIAIAVAQATVTAYAQATVRTSSTRCGAGISAELQQFQVVGVSVEDPFSFLPYVSARKQALETQLRSLLNGQVFTAERDEQAFLLVDGSGLAPDPGTNAYSVIAVECVSVQNIDPQAKTLSVLYRVLTTAPPLNFGGTIEAEKTIKTSPQTAAGVTARQQFHLLPSAGYNATFGAYGGGYFEAKPKGKLSRYIDSMEVEGQGSENFRDVNVNLQGSHQSSSWISKSQWQLSYLNQSAPVPTNNIASAALSAQFGAQTRPFWRGNGFLRAGALIQGGNMQEQVPVSSLSKNSVANAGFGSVKLYQGFSGWTSHDTVTVSYGLELGSVGPEAQIDWRKQIGDIANNFWVNLGSHQPLELESRFTVGALQVPNRAPLPVRFFGGNAEHFFIPNDSWQIRDQPFIRAIPANRLSATSEGLGGDSFSVVNLTLSYPVVFSPLVPRDASSDPAITDAIKFSLNTAVKSEKIYYKTQDPHFVTATKRLPALQSTLTASQDHVNHAQTSTTDPNLDFDDCLGAIGSALSDVNGVLKDASNYGDLAALIPLDTDDLQGVADSCGTNLNVTLNNPAIAADLDSVATQRLALIGDANQIDDAAAQKKADQDLSLVQRTVHTLFNDINTFSVRPALILDVAHLTPATAKLGGWRTGPGGGVRLELASYVNFTLGYAVNYDRKPGEDHGAFFFSMGFRDLFH